MTGTSREKCHTFLLITSRKWCLLLLKKKAITELLSGKIVGVEGNQSWRNKKSKVRSFLSPFHICSPFLRYSAVPIPNPLQVAWTQCKRCTSQTCSPQYGGYTDQLDVCVSICAPVNRSLLILSLGVQLLVSCSFCRGRETLMVLSRFVFLLQIVVTRQCEWLKIFDEKKWFHYY